MLEWSSPLWLLGLAGVPLVWLLHRLRLARPELPVSAGFLWRAQIVEDEAGRRFAEADPAWRRRALLVALLALAAAGAHWTGAERRSLEVWVDDSLSLQAEEQGGTPRYRLALAALAEALRAAAPYEATVRSLGRAERSLGFDSDSAEDGLERLAGWFEEPGAEPHPPIPAAMNPAASHWLLTDGADTALNAWAEAAPLGRIIRAGAERDNLALTVLSVRPTPDGRERLAGLIGVANTGSSPVRRTVELQAGGSLLQRWPVELAAGASARLGFDLPEAAGSSLRVLAVPGDALAADDGLSLELPGKIPVEWLGGCGPFLRAALEAHPRLNFHAGDAELSFACGENVRLDGAGIHFHSPGLSSPPAAPLFWTPAAGELRALFLDRAWLRIFRDYPFRPGEGEALLAVAGRPLIRQPAGAARLDVYLDMDDPEFARRPEYPALVAGLIGRLAPAADWGRGYASERPLEASRIAPLDMPAERVDASAGKVSAGIDLSPYLIVAALAVLALDLARSGRAFPAQRWR